MKRIMVLIMAGLLLWAKTVSAEVSKDSQLYNKMMEMDTLLFEEGFNKCNLKGLDKLIHSKLDFYHDVAGIQDKKAFMQAIAKNVCASKERKPIRKLVDGSMKVFKLMKNGELYGAIQKAEHEFYIKEPKEELYITGIAKFTHVWLVENGQWKLIESLSYEHRGATKSKNKGQKAKKEIEEKFDAKFAEELFSKDDEVLHLLQQHKIPSLGVGYIKHGKLQQIRMFGNKSEQGKDDEKAVDKDTIYKVASLTKPVVALITLKLVNEKKWDLDRPIKDYYIDPDVAKSENLNTLTTRHILSHQTGFPNWRYLKESKKLDFEFKPGERYQYSGEGFEYLRKALENNKGKKLEQLAEELIFEPLGMKNSYFYWSAEVDEERYAIEHNENGTPIKYKKHRTANAAANLLTTIEDYGKFMVHILQGANLSKDLYQDMLTNQVKNDTSKKFGLGWELFKNLHNDEFAIQHTGGDYGLKTIALLFPKSKQGLVIFVNSENGVVIWKKIIEEYFSELGESLVKANIN